MCHAYVVVKLIEPQFNKMTDRATLPVSSRNTRYPPDLGDVHDNNLDDDNNNINADRLDTRHPTHTPPLPTRMKKITGPQ